jgi:hypothetical protein
VAVCADRGLFRVGSRRTPLLAGEVQFWRLDPSDWESTLEAVASERIPIVSTYLSWRRHVLERDAPFAWRHDERLDVRRFLELCASHRLLVQLKPGPWICAEEPNGGYPDWLLADEDIRALDANGKAVAGYNPPFRHPVPCYLHPRYLEHARRWIHLVLEHVGDFLFPRGPVALIQLDNEPSYCFRDGMYEADYHPVALAAFAGWTLDRYGSLAGVSRAWQLQLQAEEEIEPPREPELGVEAGAGRWRREHDWICFREWLLAEHLRRLREAHEAAGARATVFTVNYNSHPVDGVPQSPQAIRSATGAIGGMDHYYEPPLDGDDLLAVARSTALLRAGGELLPWSPEIQSGIWRLPGERVAYPDPTAAEHELYYLAALAFGLKGLNLYMLVDRENWELAPLEPGGGAGQMLAAVRKLVRVIEHLPELGSLEPISPVALAWQTAYARDAYAAAATDAPRRLPYEETLAVFAALTRAGYLPRIWNTGQVPPEDVAAIVAPTASYMARNVQEQLVRTSTRGARVVVLGQPPGLDESGRPCHILARGVEAGDLTHLVRVADVPATLAASGIDAPVRVDETDGFAVLHQGLNGQLLFVLNARAEGVALSLRFADGGIVALRPLTEEGSDIAVAERAARIELGPYAGAVFQAATR